MDAVGSQGRLADGIRRLVYAVATCHVLLVACAALAQDDLFLRSGSDGRGRGGHVRQGSLGRALHCSEYLSLAGGFTPVAVALLAVIQSSFFGSSLDARKLTRSIDPAASCLRCPFFCPRYVRRSSRGGRAAVTGVGEEVSCSSAASSLARSLARR